MGDEMTRLRRLRWGGTRFTATATNGSTSSAASPRAGRRGSVVMTIVSSSSCTSMGCSSERRGPCRYPKHAIGPTRASPGSKLNLVRFSSSCSTLSFSVVVASCKCARTMGLVGPLSACWCPGAPLLLPLSSPTRFAPRGSATALVSLNWPMSDATNMSHPGSEGVCSSSMRGCAMCTSIVSRDATARCTPTPTAATTDGACVNAPSPLTPAGAAVGAGEGG